MSTVRCLPGSPWDPKATDQCHLVAHEKASKNPDGGTWTCPTCKHEFTPPAKEKR